MSAAWTWAGARVAGTSHQAQALPCQDAFASRVWQAGGAPPVLIAALFERFSSRGRGNFANRVFSAMREEFGGHAAKSAA